MKVDVLIVGLGPAGATTLAKLATISHSDLNILAIDKRLNPGFPVQCGEFMPSPEEMAILMPDVPNTEAFFTFEEEYIGTITNRISFTTPKGKTITTPFDGYTINRGKWNADLVDTGRSAQAEVWTSACAVGMKNGSVLVVRNEETDSPVEIEAKVIVGADGVNSRIAQWSGMNERRGPEHFAICKEHVMTEISSDWYDSSDVQMFFGEKYSPGAYAWIIPKNETTANVGTGVRLPMLRGKMNVSKALDNLLNEHPIASKALEGAHIHETIGGTVPVGLPFQKTVDSKHNILLLGDASCQVVSSVGGGIPTSMVAGTIAANTIWNFFQNNTSLEFYQTEWQSQMLRMLRKAYKLRQFFDSISTGTDPDNRIQWYMNRLRPQHISDVVHCKIPKLLTLASYFVPLVNKLV